MKSYDYENPTYFDVDDTIIFWDENHTQPFEGSVSVTCPHDGTVSYHRIHKRHVRFLKKQLAKGNGVVVWSAQGVSWAKEVVKALGLDELDLLVISKPNRCVDDLPDARQILPKIIYLHEDKYSS